MTDLRDLVALSKFAGMRFDLVQAGGGNTSVKTSDGKLKVKASGINLAQMSETFGIATLDLAKLASFVEGFDVRCLDKQQVEAHAKAAMLDANLDSPVRPSIETFLHAITPARFTLHTHPLWVNVLTSREEWIQEISEVFPSAIFVPYRTPGIELAQAMSLAMASSRSGDPVAFLQNHGLIVWGDSIQDVMKRTEDICSMIEVRLGGQQHAFRAQTELWMELQRHGIDAIVYLSNDADVRAHVQAHPQYLECKPICPDVFVYCGAEVARLSEVSDLGDLIERRVLPKVIVYQNNLYFLATSISKAREAEELLRFALLVAHSNQGKQTQLTEAELDFLGNWESEKWRQQVR